jgi:hypothetical protein
MILGVGSFSTDKYLTHYWSFDNLNLNDQIGEAHMTEASLISFTTDRFGNENSALVLNGGWTKVSNVYYFNTLEFTISVWIYPLENSTLTCIIDFGFDTGTNSVFLSLNVDSSRVPSFEISANSREVIISTEKLILEEWQLITATYIEGKMMSIYINERITGNKSVTPKLENRTASSYCFIIGKSREVNEEQYSFSYLDDLRFYNKSLTQSEIIELMKSLGKFI